MQQSKPITKYLELSAVFIPVTPTLNSVLPLPLGTISFTDSIRPATMTLEQVVEAEVFTIACKSNVTTMPTAVHLLSVYSKCYPVRDESGQPVPKMYGDFYLSDGRLPSFNAPIDVHRTIREMQQQTIVDLGKSLTFYLLPGKNTKLEKVMFLFPST